MPGTSPRIPTPRPALRPACADDIARLDAIAWQAKAHWGYDAAQLEAWADELRTPPGRLRTHPTWVAGFGGHSGPVLGFMQIDPTTTPWELAALWVLPAHMGRGIGRALLQHASVLAADAGQVALHIDADPHAAGFYRACGAVPVGAVAAPLPDAPGRERPQFRLPVAVPPARQR